MIDQINERQQTWKIHNLIDHCIQFTFESKNGSSLSFINVLIPKHMQTKCSKKNMDNKYNAPSTNEVAAAVAENLNTYWGIAIYVCNDMLILTGYPKI